MSQFTINGVTFEDDKEDYLEHTGPGKPGRAKGSRNGFLDPNAVAMKGYKVVGKPAEGPSAVLGAGEGTGRATAAPAATGSNMMRNQNRGAIRSTDGSRMMRNQNRNAITSTNNRNTTRVRAASSVKAGQNAMEKLLGSSSTDLARTQGSPTAAQVTNGQASRSALNDAFDQANNSVNDATGNFANMMQNVANSASNAARAAEDAANNVVNDVMNGRNYQHNDIARNQGNPRDQRITETAQGSGVSDIVGEAPREWYDGLLDWGRNAWNDISSAATSAIDTGKGWAKTGLDWVNDNILDPAGSWGSRALSDVGSWLGDRGRDLDRWWNGTDREVPASRGIPAGLTNAYQQGTPDTTRTEHIPGFRENVGDFLGRAGNAIGDVADRMWNGHLSGNEGDAFRMYHPGMRDYFVGNNERGVSGMFTDPLGFANQQLVEPIFGQNGVDEWSRDVSNRAGQWLGNLPGRIAQGAEDLWVGNQTIRGDQNGATSVEGNPGLRDVLFDGYAREQPVRGVPAGLTNAYQQGTPDTTRVERVPGLVEQAGNAWNEFTGNVGRGVQDTWDTASRYVQRQVIDPVTNTARTYLIDPVTNAVVAVGDFVTNNPVTNTLRGAASQFDQNVLQPVGRFARSVYDNAIEPAANWAGQQLRNAGEAIGNEVEYLGASGDRDSTELRQAGVSTRTIDDLNRRIANGNEQERAEATQFKSVMNAARRAGVDAEAIDYLYDAMQNGAIYPQTFMSNLSGLINATPEVVARQNAYYKSKPYGSADRNRNR